MTTTMMKLTVHK